MSNPFREAARQVNEEWERRRTEAVRWWDRLAPEVQEQVLRSEYVAPGFTRESFRDWLEPKGRWDNGRKLSKKLKEFAEHAEAQLGMVHLTDALERAHTPDAERGKRVRAAAFEGGRARKGDTKVPPEQLRSEVDALMNEGESLTNARRRVARNHGIGLTTVRRHTPT